MNDKFEFCRTAFGVVDLFLVREVFAMSLASESDVEFGVAGR